VIDLPYKNADVTVRKGSDLWIMVEGVGWSVMWRGEIVYISIVPSFSSHIAGLCGDYDWDPNNDFYAAYGIRENDLFTFASSFQTYKDAGCTETATRPVSACSKNPIVSYSHGQGGLCPTTRATDNIKIAYLMTTSMTATDLRLVARKIAPRQRVVLGRGLFFPHVEAD
jgi:von Willebrand factor type D domain